MPPKLIREWTALYVEGKPIYEVAELPEVEEPEPTAEQILEEERQRLLDEKDFTEYRVSDRQTETDRYLYTCSRT